jgi:hypothetical protein
MPKFAVYELWDLDGKIDRTHPGTSKSTRQREQVEIWQNTKDSGDWQRGNSQDSLSK